MILNINWIKLYIVLVILVFKEKGMNLTLFFEPSCKFTSFSLSHEVNNQNYSSPQVRSIANKIIRFKFFLEIAFLTFPHILIVITKCPNYNNGP